MLHCHPSSSLERLTSALPPDAAVIGPTFAGPWPEQLRGCVSVAINADRCAEGVASVCLNEDRVAEFAVAHLLARGFRHLTTVRFDGWARGRERRFQQVALRTGACLEPGWASDAAAQRCMEDEPGAIMAWLSGLRKPCGIFACTDAWARVVARYASLAGLRIPEELALVGVDNDALECEIAAPPLSSVAVPWASYGETAARLVQSGLRGQSIAGTRVLVEPLDVVTRRSSDTFAIEDPLVAAAVAWIHGHVEQRLSVPTVASAIRATRQRLERGFRRHLGRTVLDEIRSARVEAARRLLWNTDLPLIDIARRSGFTNAALLSVAFHREVGMPPGAYRRRVRGALSASD